MEVAKVRRISRAARRRTARFLLLIVTLSIVSLLWKAIPAVQFTLLLLAFTHYANQQVLTLLDFYPTTSQRHSQSTPCQIKSTLFQSI